MTQLQLRIVLFFSVAQTYILGSFFYEGQKLDIRPYHHTIGIIPPGFDVSKPSYGIPKDVVFSDLDNHILRFWKKSTKHRQHIVNQVNTHSGDIDWSEVQNGSMKIMCTLTYDSRDLVNLATKWKNNLESLMVKMQSHYVYREINIYQEAGVKFQNKVQNVNYNKDDIDLQVDNVTGNVSIVGENDECIAFEQTLQKIHQEVMDNLERESRVINEEMRDLSSIQVELLKMAGIRHILSDVADKLEVEDSSQTISFRGLPGPIKEAKCKIFEFLNMTRKHVYRTTRIVGRLMSSNEGKSHLKKEISALFNNPMVLEFSQDQITFHVYGIEDLAVIDNAIPGILLEEKLECSSNKIQSFSRPNWTTEIDSKNPNIRGLYVTEVVSEASEGYLLVAAMSNILIDVKNNIGHYLDENVKCSRFITMKIGVLKCLDRHLSKEISKRVYSVSPNLNLETCDKIDPPGYKIEGTEQHVRQVLKNIEEVAERVLHETKKMTNMGIKTVLTGKQGRMLLDGVETRSRVIIEIDSDAGSTMQTTDSALVVVCTAKISQNTTVLIKYGDIVKDNADALVNPANTQLHHAGGLAASIAKAGWSRLHL